MMHIDKSQFTEKQLYWIEQGLKKGLDISIYADAKYDYEQMYWIFWGLLDNLDVSYYTNPNYSYKLMNKIYYYLYYCKYGNKKFNENDINLMILES